MQQPATESSSSLPHQLILTNSHVQANKQSIINTDAALKTKHWSMTKSSARLVIKQRKLNSGCAPTTSNQVSDQQLRTLHSLDGCDRTSQRCQSLKTNIPMAPWWVKQWTTSMLCRLCCAKWCDGAYQLTAHPHMQQQQQRYHSTTTGMEIQIPTELLNAHQSKHTL